MLICDDCMECCHIEGNFIEPILIARNNITYTCEVCSKERKRFYEMEKEHIQELMRKYRQLLSEIDLTKLLDD